MAGVTVQWQMVKPCVKSRGVPERPKETRQLNAMWYLGWGPGIGKGHEWENESQINHDVWLIIF